MNLENIILNIQSWITTNGLRILGILIGVFIANLILKRIVTRIVQKFVVTREGEDEEAEEKRENTLIKIIQGTLHIILVFVAVFMVISEFGVDIAPLIAGAGIVGIAVGFGGQYIVRDIITGLFIILENQLRVGDAVTISGVSGSVEDVTLRKTILRDLDGVVHHIPNGEISTVSNMTQGLAKINLDVGVDYNTDINKLIKIINEVGDEMFNDEELKKDMYEKPYFLRVNDLADSSVEVKIMGEVRPGKQWFLTGELRKRLLEKFREHEIEIPFPQMVIHKCD